MKSKVVKPVNTGKMKAKAAAASAPADDLKARRAVKLAANAKLTQVVKEAIAPVPKLVFTALPGVKVSETPAIGNGHAPHREPAQAETVLPAEFITVNAHWISAALTIAPVKDVRGVLNSVRIHQTATGATRVVSTDGKRLFVAQLEGLEKVSWGEQGVCLPVDALTRVQKFAGGGALKVGYGPGLPNVLIEDEPGTASFKVKPVEGNYPDYQRVIDAGGEVFSTARGDFESSQLDSKFLKSAGIVAGQLNAPGITPYVGDDRQPVIFTFAKVPEAMLYIMPMTSVDQQLAAPTVKLFGREAIQAMIAKLEAAEKVSRANAKTTKVEKFRVLAEAKVERLSERLASLRAIVSVKIEAPKTAASAPAPKVVSEAPASVQ